MFRRAVGPQVSRILARTSSSARCFTNYDHMKYPVDRQAFLSIIGYFFVMWLIMARMGSLFTRRSEYKKDQLRVWRRKLGKGYQWSDAWGPQMDTGDETGKEGKKGTNNNNNKNSVGRGEGGGPPVAVHKWHRETMRRTSWLSCKAVFDLRHAARFATGVVVDRPVAFINGAFVTPASGTAITVEDPCTQTPIGEVPNMGKDETLQAIDAAKSAFEGWKNMMPRERAVIMHRWAQLMLRHSQSLGSILSRESGKVLAEGVAECLYAERYLEWYAGEVERVYGDIIGGPREGVVTTVVRRPVGVVGVITPWNFPSSMVTRAVGGALAGGCTVVLKPSELTPFSALVLAQLAAEAGVPDGVFNVLTGDAEPIGDALLDSFDVRKIAFTGSTRTGKHLYARSASTMKKLGLELGGNAPFIVFDDADLSRAVGGLMASKFRNAGQACISSNRVFIHEAIHDAFVARLVEEARTTLRVGNSFDEHSKMGSLINSAAVDRMEALVSDAVAKGAKVELGGNRIPGPGYFFEPTVLTRVRHNAMDCCQQEIFGPIIPIIKFSSESEVVQMANATTAGLAAYIYTQDYRRQSRVSEQLHFGMVGVNDVGLSSPCAPFGGVKESGLGRDGSKYGIDAFVDIKYVLESRI